MNIILLLQSCLKDMRLTLQSNAYAILSNLIILFMKGIVTMLMFFVQRVYLFAVVKLRNFAFRS